MPEELRPKDLKLDDDLLPEDEVDKALALKQQLNLGIPLTANNVALE